MSSATIPLHIEDLNTVDLDERVTLIQRSASRLTSQAPHCSAYTRLRRVLHLIG